MEYVVPGGSLIALITYKTHGDKEKKSGSCGQRHSAIFYQISFEKKTLTRAHDQEHSEQIFKKHWSRCKPVFDAFPYDFEGYIKLEAVREENGNCYHDFYGLRQPVNKKDRG